MNKYCDSLMKELKIKNKIMFKEIKKWLIQWWAFVFIVAVSWISYAAFTNITTVNSWETLTASKFNELINNQADLNTRINNVLWVWQTWQNVLSIRSPDVTYTNNTGKPIMISIYWNTSAGNSLSLWVNWTIIAAGNSNATTWVAHTVTGIIPDGANYLFKTYNWTIYSWYELR